MISFETRWRNGCLTYTHEYVCKLISTFVLCGKCRVLQYKLCLIDGIFNIIERAKSYLGILWIERKPQENSESSIHISISLILSLTSAKATQLSWTVRALDNFHKRHCIKSRLSPWGTYSICNETTFSSVRRWSWPFNYWIFFSK